MFQAFQAFAGLNVDAFDVSEHQSQRTPCEYLKGTETLRLYMCVVT